MLPWEARARTTLIQPGSRAPAQVTKISKSSFSVRKIRFSVISKLALLRKMFKFPWKNKHSCSPPTHCKFQEITFFQYKIKILLTLNLFEDPVNLIFPMLFNFFCCGTDAVGRPFRSPPLGPAREKVPVANEKTASTKKDACGCSERHPFSWKLLFR